MAGDSHEDRKLKNKNPYIENMKADALYHIGLNSGVQDLKSMFGDVKVSIVFLYICIYEMIRSYHRLEWFFNDVCIVFGKKTETVEILVV